MTGSRRSKAVAILVGAGTIGALGVAVFWFRKPLVDEWTFRRAARECARAWEAPERPDDAGEPRPVLAGLVARGAEGYPVLARLIAHPDRDVAASARVGLYDAAHSGAFEVDSFLEHLARVRPAPLFDFRPQGYTCCGVDPAGTVELNIPGCDDDGIEGIAGIARFYLGRTARSLRPTAEAVEVARRRLRDSDSDTGPDPDREDQPTEADSDFAWVRDFETVDIAALMASSASGGCPDGSFADRDEDPGASAALAALDLLRDVALDRATYPELRLHALNRLELVRAGESAACLPQLWHWEMASKFPVDAAHPPPWRPWGVYLEPAALRALLSLEHPRVLRILARLQRTPEAAALIEEADAGLSGGGAAAPAWLPLHERAARWLEGTRSERALAAEALAELAPEDAAPLVAGALARETDPEVRLRMEASLVALGEGAAPESPHDSGALRERVRRAFLERAAVWRRAFPPWEEEALRSPDRRWIRSPARPADLESENRAADLVSEDAYRVSPLALGLALSRSGLREDLELVVDAILPSGYVPLVAVELGRAIEGIPAIHVELPLRRLSADELVSLLDSWRASRDGLAWDPASRRWMGWVTPPSEEGAGEPGND